MIARSTIALDKVNIETIETVLSKTRVDPNVDTRQNTHWSLVNDEDSVNGEWVGVCDKW